MSRPVNRAAGTGSPVQSGSTRTPRMSTPATARRRDVHPSPGSPSARPRRSGVRGREVGLLARSTPRRRAGAGRCGRRRTRVPPAAALPAPAAARAAPPLAGVGRPPRTPSPASAPRQPKNSSAVSYSPGSSSLGSRSASSSATSTISVPRSADHRAEAPAGDGVHRGDAEACGEHAIERHRRASALDVTEDRHARLVSGPPLDLALERHADPAEPGVAEGVGGSVSSRICSVPSRGVAPSATTTIEKLRPRSWRRRRCMHTSLDVERALGNEDRVGAARDPGVRGDPAGVAAHHLDAPSRGCATRRSCAGGRSRRSRSAPPSESRTSRRCRRDRCRSSSALPPPECPRGAIATPRRACPRRRSGSARRSRARASVRRIAAPVSVLAVGERVGARRAEDRAAAREDARGALQRQLDRVVARARRPSRGESRGSCVRPPGSPRRTTARMTAFRPGQSPPPVSRPTRAMPVIVHHLACHGAQSRRSHR